MKIFRQQKASKTVFFKKKPSKSVFFKSLKQSKIDVYLDLKNSLRIPSLPLQFEYGIMLVSLYIVIIFLYILVIQGEKHGILMVKRGILKFIL